MSNKTCLNFSDFFESAKGKTRSSTEEMINQPNARSNIKNIRSLPEESKLGMKYPKKSGTQTLSVLINI
jgi:hypothetical protein